MQRLSMEQAFTWAQAFAAREWRLLLPVALAFLALPPLMMDLLVPQSIWDAFAAAVQTQNPQLAAGGMRVVVPVMGIVLVVATVGGLAVTALALLPAITVGEALLLGLRRLPVMIAAIVLVALGQLGGAMLLSILAALLRLTGAGVQSLLLGVVLGVSLFVMVRLILIGPMIVTRRIGPTAAISESWHATHGAFWPILAAVLIYAVGAFVVTIALTYALGVIITLVAKAMGAAELGRIVIATILRLIGALMGVGFHLLIAGIFRQRSDAPIRGM